MKRFVVLLIAAVLAMALYLPASAAIPYNYVVNGGFETDDMTLWKVENAKMEFTTSQKHGGNRSLRIYDRTNEWGQVLYDVTDVFMANGKGGQYRISSFMKASKTTGSPDEKLLIRLLIMSNNGGKADIQNWYYLPEMLPKTEWVDAGADGSGGYYTFATSLGDNITWIGELKSALLIFGIPANTYEFYLDDVAFWKEGGATLTTTGAKTDSNNTTKNATTSTTVEVTKEKTSTTESVATIDSKVTTNTQENTETTPFGTVNTSNQSAIGKDSSPKRPTIILAVAVVVLVIGGGIFIYMMLRRKKSLS